MAKKRGKGGENPVIATNRSASHEYHILSRIEAGIVLTGPEVKSARERRVNLRDAYARVRQGEIYLLNCHISPYNHARMEDADPVRARKLLLHAREIRKLGKQTEATGMTLVPTRMYLKGGRIKVEIAVARGKRAHDKRESLRRKDAEREMERGR